MNKSIILKIFSLSLIPTVSRGALTSLLLTLLFYTPLLVNPQLFLNRGNDLQEQFWPVMHFIQKSFVEHGQIPLWNNLFFAGIPILPDPQFPLFYPFTILFLILPTDTAFIFYFIIHTFLGGFGMYLLAKKWLRLSDLATFLAMALYIFAPKLAGYVEAGHYGLIGTNGWLPLLLFATVNTVKKYNFKMLALYSVSLAGLFYTHTLVFLSGLFMSIVFSFSLLLGQRNKMRKILLLFFGILLATGLVAVSLLPQVEWSTKTTRFLLLDSPDVYPKWDSIFEFFKVLFVPWKGGIENVWKYDSEKWITVGILPTLISIIGFISLKWKTKLFICLLFFGILFLALNNLNPFDYFMLTQRWYVLMRVSTRTWFIMTLSIPLLAGTGISIIEKHFKPLVVKLLILLAAGEYLFLSFSYMAKPVNNLTFVGREVYEFLRKDKDIFRIYCTTRCLSLKEVAKNNLELIDGYNTLQQTNYFNHSQKLMGGIWNYYTLSLPPFEAYLHQNLQPDATALGKYNTKYVISPYILTNPGFELIKSFGKYKVYQNKTYLPRATSPILVKTPNVIKIDTSKTDGKPVILSEVYSAGWKAYLNGKEEETIIETEDSLRQIEIKENTKYVVVKYLPNSFIWGAVISIATLLIISIGIIRSRQKNL